MSSNNATQFTAYNNYINDPSPKNALEFVFSCHNYISVLASKWHQPNMTRKVKINEIISEMYLILLEDFSSKKAITCQSAFAYLDSKLRRLVNPAKPHFFSDIDEISPDLFASIDSMTFEKVSMIKEIVKIIRKNVLKESYDNSGLILFLFIHIYPKIHWISELFAKKEKIPVEDRYEADAKRIKRFNNNLRIQFNSLSNGDWREIMNWNRAERSHLAWKIINICPEEVDSDTADFLIKVDNWRENFDVHSLQNLENLNLAEKVFKSMANNLPKTDSNMIVAEESDFWGKPIDILSMLIEDYYNEKSQVEEPGNDLKSLSLFSEYSDTNVESDREFMEVATELNKWFGKLLTERNKRSLK